MTEHQSSSKRELLNPVPTPTLLFDEMKKENGSAIQIWMAMARFYHMQELLTVGIIAGESGLSRSTVARYMDPLVEGGWVTKTVDVTPTGTVLETKFQVHFEKEGPGHTLKVVVENGAERSPIPDRTIVETYTRDGFRCVYCESIERLTIDHIIPVTRGGGNDPENLQTLCRKCNSAKGAKAVG